MATLKVQKTSKNRRNATMDESNLFDEIYVGAVGMRFNAGPSFQFSKTMKLKLVPDTHNPHDEHAIKVMVGERHVAYISKTHSKQISEILKKGGVIHSVQYVPELSKELFAVLIVRGESPALAYMKRTYLKN